MNIIVCGSRGFSDTARVTGILREFPDATIWHGGADGADTCAELAAGELGLDTIAHIPDWKLYGKKAGILRNLHMLAANPDLVIAFWDGESRGTKHMINESLRRGIELRVYQ